MSGAEEYLDGLLHSVEGGSPADTARETEPGDTADGLYAEKEQETKKAGMSEEDDFLKSFEADTDLEVRSAPSARYGLSSAWIVTLSLFAPVAAFSAAEACD